MSSRRLVSIVVPCLNEAADLADFLAYVDSQERLDTVDHEVIVVDGGSTDGTLELLTAWVAVRPHARLLHNPHGLVAHGLNQALEAARGDVVIRMDVHTRYAPDYVGQSIRALDETGADCVGGPWVAEGRGYFGRAVAHAFQSRFGTGGSLAKARAYEGPVDTVYLGCWRRETFDRHGPFDTSLVRSQDSEMNWRIREAGGVVWQTPRIRSWYRTRSSMRTLFAQYRQYGYWKLRVMAKHPGTASLAYALPAAFVACVALLLVLAPWIGTKPLLALLAAYGAATLLASLLVGFSQRAWRWLPALPLAFATMHVAHGLGFIASAVDRMLGRTHHPAMAVVTRPAAREKVGSA